MALAATQDHRSLKRCWLAAFGAAFVLYSLTATPDPEWQDSGWQQLRILRKQVEHPLGLALVHPLHHFLGRAAVFCLRILEPAYAITLVSAIAGSFAVANVAAIVLVMTRRFAAALVASTALALSHTFWQHSTHTESYALTAAMLSGEWLCLALFSLGGRPSFLLAMMLFNGLGISNHLMASIATPVDLVVLILARNSRRITNSQIVLSVLALCAGAMPYISLAVLTMAATRDVGGTIHSALFGSFAPAVLNTSVSANMLTKSAGYIAYNFPNLTIPMAAVGVFHRRDLDAVRPAQAWPNVLVRVLLSELILYAIFLARYAITDQYTFFLPLYAIIAVLAGFGAASLKIGFRGLLIGAAVCLNLANPFIYVLSANVLARRNAFPAVEGKPYRDGYRALFVPWGRGDDHTRRMNEAVLNLAGDHGMIVVVDPMMGFSLDYLALLHRIPPGVSIRSIATLTPQRAAPIRREMEDALRGGWPVILVPEHRDRTNIYFEDAVWERSGDLYILKHFKIQTNQ